MSEEARIISARDQMLCWNPGTSEVAIFNHPDHSRLSRRYRMSAFACYEHWSNLSREQMKAMIFIEAWHLVVRDRCDPAAVHKALIRLREYQDGLSDDFPGFLSL